MMPYKDQGTGDMYVDMAEMPRFSTLSKESSVGVVTSWDGVVALDVDVPHPEFAKVLMTWFKEHYPGALIRNGTPPKFAVLFSGDKSLRDTRNGASAKFAYGDATCLIELFIKNQVLTIIGPHRKTQKDYSFSGASPLQTDALDLDVLTKTDLAKVMEMFKATGSRYNDLKHKARASISTAKKKLNGVNGLARTAHSPFSGSIEELVQSLNLNIYHDWWRLGAALHAETNANLKGLAAWKDYTRRYAPTSYEESEFDVKWSSFSVDGGLTLDSLHNNVVFREGDDVLKDMLCRYIFIVTGSQVWDRLTSRRVSLKDFHAKHANKHVLVSKTKGKGEKAIVEQITVAASKLWLTHEDRVTTEAITFYPNRGLIFSHGGEDLLNTFVQSPCELRRRKHNIVADFSAEKIADYMSVFMTHIEYLFPDADTSWFMSWAAHMIQKPDERPPCALLHISTHMRTGRGWLGQLLAKFVADAHAETISIQKLCDATGKTGFLCENILTIVEECAITMHNRRETNDHLKSLIAAVRLRLDPKYEPETVQQLYTRLFLQTNYIDAVPMPYEDERFYVSINRKKRHSKEYYKNLYKHLEDADFVATVYDFLRRYQYDKEALYCVPRSKAKLTAVKATMSKLERAVRSAFGFDVVSMEHSVPCMDDDTLKTEIRRYYDAHYGITAVRIADNELMAVLRAVRCTSEYVPDMQLLLHIMDEDVVMDVYNDDIPRVRAALEAAKKRLAS